MQAFAHLDHLFAKKKSSASLRRKQSQSSLQTPSDQLPREQKSAPYKNPNYPVELEEEGSYMRDFDDNDDIPRSARDLCRTLLKNEQMVPRDSLFRDDLFKKTCRNLQDRNEAMVIRDIGLLIAPSAQILATYGATHLNFVYETTNEGWNSIYSFPLHRTRPQPDFSVGFGRSAFNQEQLTKLKPFAGEPGSITFFMATARMYFPFFTCEVKCGAAALDIADRQNAHSMTVAVRALVELFRSVKREKELDRQILTFSVSHDHTSVRIYGHYAVIEGQKTTFYRHTIRKFDFTEQDGEEKWTAYKFVKNVYDYHSLKLHGMICSCLDDLPVIDFDPSQSALFSQYTSQNSQAESALGGEDSQSSVFASQELTPTTSFTQANEPASKKPKKQRTGGKR